MRMMTTLASSGMEFITSWNLVMEPKKMGPFRRWM